MKDLGDASHILDMPIVQNRDKKVLFLSRYTSKVLKCLNVEEGKALSACWGSMPPMLSYR